ncbi:Uncharacterized protein C8034_v012400 [Colletotrichum sidae]|uniref:FAD-binding domain-containing protein n=1 Tax=Colletotrichum sidae TaxID=1347389 RepID=A0A4R8TEN8_9PEZI|nr:Uncharacterized protein C8034_v012400 [Colletotrichum sidae]
MRVLISGAGVAGPTLAWFLAKAGARVTVVEKSRNFLRQGQNVDVNHAAIRVIKNMGLIEELRRWNTTEKGTQFIDPRGRAFAPFPVTPGSDLSFTSEFEILRGDCAGFLYEASKKDANVEYLFGTTCKQIIANNNKGVEVELSNGEVQRYDVLVAADGQWSQVRKQVFPEESVTVVDKDMYVAYATIPRVPEDNDWWNVYQALDSRIVTTRPDPHGTIRAMFTRMPLSDDQRRQWQAAARSDRQTQQELLRKEFADAGWQSARILDGMEAAEDYYFQAVQQIKMAKWSSGRVVCLGDAAWAPSPLTGMGTSLAITGAYVLAGEMSKLEGSEHPSRAFDAFESRFRSYVEETQRIPFVFPGLVHPVTPAKRWLFNSVVAGMSKVITNPWVSKTFFQGKDTEDSDYKLPEYPKFEGYFKEPAV